MTSHAFCLTNVARARRHRLLVLLASLVLALLAPARAIAQSAIAVPDVRGDQLLYFFDARAGRTSFLLIGNPGDAAVAVEVAFYPTSLASKLGSTTLEIAAAGHSIVDPSTIAGVAGGVGLAVVTPVAAVSDASPVVPPAPLTGSFTLANTALASAFGENALGRLAVTSGGKRATPGAAVDGASVRYQRFAPAVLAIPVYFAPPSLGAVENDGNRVVLASFADQYGAGGFALAPSSTSLGATYFDGGGSVLVERSVAVSGVLLSDLQSIAGPDRALTSSGKAFFAVAAPEASVFGVFAQSLGTFASGHRMAAVDAVPTGTVAPAGCTQVDVTASVAWTADTQVSGVTARIGYDPSLASLPGTGSSDTVRARVTNLTGVDDGLLESADQARPGSSADDQASVALVSLARAIPAGPFARLRFDCVGGARPPVAADFACASEAAAFDGSPVTPTTCSVGVTVVSGS